MVANHQDAKGARRSQILTELQNTGCPLFRSFAGR